MEAAEQQPASREDLSSRTVVVLVALTLVVSFISAWVSISSAESAGVLRAPAAERPASQAFVSFAIEEPNRAAATGEVVLEIRQLP